MAGSIALALAVLVVSPTKVTAKEFWTASPADPNSILFTAYTIGNGHQAGMPLGIPGKDVVLLNHDSLWSGGPFANTSYTGGNPTESLAHYLPGVQEWIFLNGTGNETVFYGSTNDYGSYEMLGYLTVEIAGVENYTDYKRSLDLETALHSVNFTSNEANFSIVQFCSYPIQACVYHIASTKPLPDITIGLVDDYRTNPASNSTCHSSGVRLRGQTEADPGMGNIGMTFDAEIQAVSPSARSLNIKCNLNDSMVVSGGTETSLTLILTTGTNYDQKKGNAASHYSFKGGDPYPRIQATLSTATKMSYSKILSDHVADHQTLFSRFAFDLPDPNGSASVDTTTLLTEYTTDIGDPFVENLIVDYGRYMYIASSRPGSLPPNLQGHWAPSIDPPWSADYHIDINVQMNNWFVEKMGLGDLTEPLWDFITDTWVPRGTESARLLYNASGWTAFTNLNIFGATGQMNGALWSDVQHDPTWMMQHVWDHYEYGQDKQWYQSVGYPLMKGCAQFWLSMLVEDEYFKDGTLVANPCNSPEQDPTTFGCAQFQQVIWELFDHIISSWDATGDTDQAFLQDVKRAYGKLYNGVRVGSWGQIQEWKLDIDVINNTHRHLSHLTGWFPGYSIAGVYGDNSTITTAVATSLYSRGNGTIDSNTGWEKAWRAACWGVLGIVDEAYTEFKYTIDMNFAPNGLSVFASGSWPFELAQLFQIDANFGLAGAALAMLVKDLPQAYGDTSIHKVLLGPSIPKAWSPGGVRGMRVRGGGSLDFSWDESGLVTSATLSARTARINVVNKNGEVLATV